MSRVDGRTAAELRSLKFSRNYLTHAEGSCLVQAGGTHVLCAATVEERVPPFLKGKAQGWVTAEYSMLPRSSTERVARDAYRGGRSLEISRLIGRSLRAVTNLATFGERTITLDCDVLEADGGTRTAAINGAFVALHDALYSIANRGGLSGPPLRDQVVAVSVGKVAGDILLDLCYLEDSTAEADMNVVMTGAGHFVEVQGTAEQGTFSRAELTQLLRFAERGLKRVVKAQSKTIGDTLLFAR
ncbi:MAG: ribonuclease PH [Candidatus Eiseniibacteriota bacterium]